MICIYNYYQVIDIPFSYLLTVELVLRPEPLQDLNSSKKGAGEAERKNQQNSRDLFLLLR